MWSKPRDLLRTYYRTEDPRRGAYCLKWLHSQNRAGDQPSDIKEQVESLVRSYIENPQAIILAVHPATADLANGKSLNIAHEVDPEGIMYGAKMLVFLNRLQFAKTRKFSRLKNASRHL